MARKSETRHIDGTDYTVLQLGATKAREVLVRIMRIAGPALKGLAGGRGAYVAALGTLLESLRDEDVSYLCETFKPVTTLRLADGKEPAMSHAFEDHFAGDGMPAMVKWLAFCLEINFRSFFPDLAAIEKLLKDASPAAGATIEPLTSPTQSTGASGGS